MANATSQFLRTANAAVQSSTAQAPSEADILTQLASGKASDVMSLAAATSAPPNLVEDVIGALVRKRFLDFTEHGLKLSDTGARAVRYLKLTEF